jgi:hypothetical protein
MNDDLGPPKSRYVSTGLIRIVVSKPQPGFHHPASKREVLSMLKSIGPSASYGLRSIELKGSALATNSRPVFGRYCVPGRIILFAQPAGQWRVNGVLKADLVRQMERAGARLTRLADIGVTLVDWAPGALKRFMLEEVLLHELGHHVLQHYKGKRRARVARTRDHEAFAARFAEKQGETLKKGRS